ncbi:MAG TPA: hypothetical protein VMF53_11910 [Alphaproteobacteria bacterium]|nr:hypothetical protein [Alphaproteobacteria bacterium]
MRLGPALLLGFLAFVLAACYRQSEAQKLQMDEAAVALDKRYWIAPPHHVELCPGLGSILSGPCLYIGGGPFVVDNVIQNKLGWTYYHVKFDDGHAGFIAYVERTYFTTHGVAGTNLYPAGDGPERQAVRQAECTNELDCEVKWGRALQWVRETSPFRLRYESRNLIQTSGPERGNAAVAFTVTRMPEVNGTTGIEFSAHCGYDVGCAPPLVSLKANFVRYVMGD